MPNASTASICNGKPLIRSSANSAISIPTIRIFLSEILEFKNVRASALVFLKQAFECHKWLILHCLRTSHVRSLLPGPSFAFIRSAL